PEPRCPAIKTMDKPLFRKPHVRLLATGHDHLYDHWVERYDDKGVTYRMDTLVTGGGGAPIYGYIGAPALRGDPAGAPAGGARPFTATPASRVCARTPRRARRRTSASST